MNSGSNSSRNLTASGDLVISLFLSHKALYPSRTQAYTHLHADTAMRKHTCTHTDCLLFSFFVYSSLVKKSVALGIVLQEQSTRTSTDVFENRCTSSHMNTHADTLFVHAHRCSFTKAARHNISHEPKPLII